MTKIGIMGDTHGRFDTIKKGSKKFASRGIETIVQVGDFGFWPGKPGQEFLNEVSVYLQNAKQEMFVVPGNHEDYPQIKTFAAEEDGWLRAKPRIRVAPRGYRWEWDTRSFVALGGAPSVDRSFRIHEQRRTSHPLWWADEEVTEEDVAKTVDGGFAEVMFAHDAPLGVPTIEKRIAANPHRFFRQDLDYALIGREKMLKAITGVKPKMYFHGHYHFVVRDLLPVEGHNVEIYGMSADGTPGTYGILDLEDLSFSFLE